MIVVDVNVIAYLWLEGDMTPLAEKTLLRDPHWIAPLLWKSEFRNILAGYLRRGTLTLQAATRCLEGAETQMAGHEFAVPSSLVMPLLASTSCSAYDCEYAALARDLGLSLVTADEHLAASFPETAIRLRTFAAKP